MTGLIITLLIVAALGIYVFRKRSSIFGPSASGDEPPTRHGGSSGPNARP